MNRLLRLGASALLILALGVATSFAQDKKDEKKDEGFKFTDDAVVKTTSVKDQNRAGTCWSYSALGFFESELLRAGKGEYDLSEMFVVRKAYVGKADAFVRYHGTVEFAGGGSFKDVQEVLRRDGIVPNDVYEGLNYGETNHVHGEMDAILRSYVEAVIKNRNRRLSTAWMRGYEAVLDAYLGKVPEKFKYKGKEYTPKSFMEALGLDMDNYISVTSYTHHPFWKEFILEIPDNWAHGADMNVPLDDMMAIIDNALRNGYPVGWGSDVSEKGFMYRKGVAVIPVKADDETADAEILKWAKLSKEEREKMLKSIDQPVPEMKITQELRQKSFDNWETTDDHGMVIVGIAHDQNGTKYYKVKNSWTAKGIYKGYFYASEAFVRYKTMDIMVNKNAVPKNLRKKMGIK